MVCGDFFFWGDSDQHVVFFLLIAPVDGLPACIDQYTPFCLEMMRQYLGDACGHQVFCCGEKHRHKAFNDQIIQLLLGFAQIFWGLQGWNDRKVIGYF